MDKIKVHDKIFRPYIRYEEFSKDIDRVAAQLNADFKDSGEVPILLCILNGSVMFTGELMQRLDFPMELASIKVSSYMGTQSTGIVELRQPLTCDVKDRTVIIVEDIVDTGYTIELLKSFLREKGAKETRVCTLFFKDESYQFTGRIKIDYVARHIQNQFIVGFGLDYNEQGRNSRDIYILDE